MAQQKKLAQKRKGRNSNILSGWSGQANAEKMPVNSASLFLRRCAFYSSQRLPPNAQSENSSGAASSHELRTMVASNAEIAQLSPSGGSGGNELDLLDPGPRQFAQAGAEAPA